MAQTRCVKAMTKPKKVSTLTANDLPKNVTRTTRQTVGRIVTPLFWAFLSEGVVTAQRLIGFG